MRRLIFPAAAFACAAAFCWAEAWYLPAGILAILAAMLLLLLRFEGKALRAEELVILAVMVALAAVARVPFAAWPSVQPTSFVIIMAGAAFGAEAGVLVGCAAAFVSNLFLGQGPWTAWQMAAWGLMGLSAGLLRRILMKYAPIRMLFGAVWGFLFGWIMNLWFVLSMGEAFTPAALIAAAAASASMDLAHAVCNAVLLGLFGGAWGKTLCRTAEKYALFCAARLRAGAVSDTLSGGKELDMHGMDSGRDHDHARRD